MKLALILLAALGVFALAFILRLAFVIRRESKETCRQFHEQFPGKCLVCAFHRYGIHHGHEQPGTLPRPHRCIEMEREQRP